MSLKSLWKKEYSQQGIPSSYKTQPSQAVIHFMQFLEEQHKTAGPILDLGCGKGRNSLYFAEKGFDTFSIDLLPENSLFIQELASKLKLPLKAYCQSVTDPLPFAAKTFESAIDIFCYKHQTDEQQRFQYRQELHRVLKDDGFYLLSLASYEDGFYGPLRQDLSKTYGTIIDPFTSIPSVIFSKEDIEQEFQPLFNIVGFTQRESTSHMHGQLYPRVILEFIMQKAN
ncbi:class I SAM-dependent methyltransferase [Candidatus Protochlamydia phocaeensis]|uniref:class I SAM-dependent methyltransferase n=1 Tax=Candidatus Protochlamydia phocaeensis TaxID=1414722 RepID=UPI0008390F27|nr:class I SAM-dependent methyltransferase [Candidatus Protochlamydia phocaeensis]